MNLTQQELEELLAKITLYNTLNTSVTNMLNGQLANAATVKTLQKEQATITERLDRLKLQDKQL